MNELFNFNSFNSYVSCMRWNSEHEIWSINSWELWKILLNPLNYFIDFIKHWTFNQRIKLSRFSLYKKAMALIWSYTNVSKILAIRQFSKHVGNTLDEDSLTKRFHLNLSFHYVLNILFEREEDTENQISFGIQKHNMECNFSSFEDFERIQKTWNVGGIFEQSWFHIWISS